MIRAVLVDDEPLALQLMAQKLQTFPNVEVVETFSNPLLLLEQLPVLSFNTAFLDIDMPGMSGLELAERLLEYNPNIHIVFVTAYREYAVEAFEIHSIDYLMKPLLKERLQKTIARIKERLEDSPAAENNPAEPMRVYSFPEFIVYCHGELVKWKTAKVKELFAYLLAHHCSHINRDVLIDVLWPDTDYAKAKVQMHTAISHLRKTLEAMGYTKVLTFTNQSYCLQLYNFFFDAMQIEQLAKSADEVTDETLAEYISAVDAYQGEFLEHEAYSWADPHAQTMRQAVQQVIEQIVQYYRQKGDVISTQSYLKRSLQLNPYSEQALQNLLVHYFENNNRSEAIKVYEQFNERVKEEFGISPGRKTTALYDKILLSDL